MPSESATQQCQNTTTQSARFGLFISSSSPKCVWPEGADGWMIEEVFVSPFNSVSVSDLQLALLPLCSTFLQPYAHRWCLNTLKFEPYCNEPTHHHGRPHAVCRIGPRHESSSFPFFSLLFPSFPSSSPSSRPPVGGKWARQVLSLYSTATPCHVCTERAPQNSACSSQHRSPTATTQPTSGSYLTITGLFHVVSPCLPPGSLQNCDPNL